MGYVGTLALDGGEWPVSLFSYLISGNRAPGTH